MASCRRRFLILLRGRSNISRYWLPLRIRALPDGAEDNTYANFQPGPCQTIFLAEGVRDNCIATFVLSPPNFVWDSHKM